jgi:hypothetical protein
LGKQLNRCRACFVQVQLRKWIRNLSALEEAVPSAKCLSRSTRGSPQYRTSEEDYSSLDESNNIIDDCRLYANECGGHFRVVQPTPLRPAFVGAKRAMGEITTQPTPLRPAFVNAKRAMGEVIATQWHPGHDPNRHGQVRTRPPPRRALHVTREPFPSPTRLADCLRLSRFPPQVAYEAFPGWPNVLVLATGSVCIPMPMDSRYSQGQNAQSQHNQPVHNIYPPAHACAQPQHANQNAPAPAVQAQAAPTGFVKQPPVQRTPLGRAVTLPQTGQTREPPTPMMSGSDSAFNCVGLTKSPSLRAREEQACAAQVRPRSDMSPRVLKDMPSLHLAPLSCFCPRANLRRPHTSHLRRN